MNIVVDDAAEVYVKDAKPRREIGMLHIYTDRSPKSLSLMINFVAGRILLKGDNITLIQQVV